MRGQWRGDFELTQGLGAKMEMVVKEGRSVEKARPRSYTKDLLAAAGSVYEHLVTRLIHHYTWRRSLFPAATQPRCRPAATACSERAKLGSLRVEAASSIPHYSPVLRHCNFSSCNRHLCLDPTQADRERP